MLQRTLLSIALSDAATAKSTRQMMIRNRSFLLPLAAAWLAIGFPADVSWGADPTDTEQMRLRTALLPTDPAGLVHFFRLRAQGEPAREKLSRLIEALHSPMPTACQQACAELVAIGKPALPLLRATVTRNANAHAVALARRCQKAIETDDGTLTVAVARLLAQCRPSGMAGVLLDYLPHAENESVRQELQYALNTAAYDEKGIADPAVVKALSDQHPLRRATAVSALAQGNLSRHQHQLRKLLLDPTPSVRLCAALALAQAADPDAQAISMLIALLGELADPEACEMIEDFLSELAGELGPKVRLGPDKTTRRKARDAWATWWRGTEGIDLLDELKKRTTSDADLDKMRSLIQKLGDDRFPVRQKVQADLIRLGVAALPLLKQALKDPDAEVRWRARDAVASIEIAKDEFLLLRLPVLARLIALRKPAGAAEAILAYLPSLDDEGLIEELQYTLNAVAFSDGKPPAALLKGLTDKSGVRRAAAAEALCVGRWAGHLKAVRKLLNDAEPSVRLKVALALAGAGDRAAVPALISLVAELPAEQSLRAEAYLNQLARVSRPPNLPDGEESKKKRSKIWYTWWEANQSEENKKKRSKIWYTWWEANQSKVALIDSSSVMRERLALSRGGSLRGYTLLVQQRTNTVTELDHDSKPRWTLTGLLQPCDAQVLAGGQRVLVAEQNRVTERDLRGRILWQKEVPSPCNVQRLRNGNTFIACQNQLIEVDRAGREVLRIALRVGIVAARKLPDGWIVAFDRNHVIQLDKTGCELLKRTRTQVSCGGCGCNEVLDNGHVLVASPGFDNLIELDADGKEVGHFSMEGVVHGFRLPNGHTLVTKGDKCVELDKKWKPIKETSLQTPAWRVKRR